MAVSSNPPFYRYEHEGILQILKDTVERGVHLTGLTNPQIRHACIQEGLILGMGSVALEGNNSADAINNYGHITDHCLSTPTPEYTFKVK